MTILETDRLVLRQFTTDDAEFIFGLTNEASYLKYIGDKGIRSADDAVVYLLQGPIDSYSRNGFGLYLVTLREGGLPIGTCGLIKRDALEHPDIGFAFLPAYWSKGYGFEAASAVLTYAREQLHLGPILAIAQTDNASSIRLLERLGMSRRGVMQLTPDDHEVALFELGA